MGYRDLRFLTSDEVEEIRNKTRQFGRELGHQYVGLISIDTHGLALEAAIAMGFVEGVAEEYDKALNEPKLCPECGWEMVLIDTIPKDVPVVGLSETSAHWVCENRECNYEEKVK